MDNLEEMDKFLEKYNLPKLNHSLGLLARVGGFTAAEALLTLPHAVFQPKNSGTSKPPPASESLLQTACPPAAVPVFGVQQLRLCPWSQAAWAHTPAAGCGNCRAGSSDITLHP